MYGYSMHTGGVCGHCLKSPCRCGGGLFLGAALKTASMGAGMLAAMKSMGAQAGWSWCQIPCDTGILVHALPGERRIVPYQVRNDTACPVTVTPRLHPWHRCGCDGEEVDVKAGLQGEGPFELEPCGTANFDIVIDTSGLKACQCYCATLELKGVCCDPVLVVLCVGGKRPAVCRHDTSRLRAWVRACCFSWKGPAYVAPAPLVGDCGERCG